MNLESMWEALEKYQKYADKRGFGAEWLRMTTERSIKAATSAAWRAAEKADPRNYIAESAAHRVANALKWAETATREINEAIELESKDNV